MILKEIILQAARAHAIPAGEAGLWSVTKVFLNKNILAASGIPERLQKVPAGEYTNLFRLTDATMHKWPGECVMQDTPHELRQHLEFMLKAKGRVLVTGLGLGCVTRGLLMNLNVESVTVIERDSDVMKLVAPYMPKDCRLSIIVADAQEWVKQTDLVFDCAWHDIWTDESRGEPHLASAHMELICAMAGRVKMQGAWAFPRYFRSRMEFAGVI